MILPSAMVVAPTEGLRWYLTDASRIIVRPSGTEPKLKVTSGDRAGDRR